MLELTLLDMRRRAGVIFEPDSVSAEPDRVSTILRALLAHLRALAARVLRVGRRARHDDNRLVQVARGEFEHARDDVEAALKCGAAGGAVSSSCCSAPRSKVAKSLDELDARKGGRVAAAAAAPAAHLRAEPPRFRNAAIGVKPLKLARARARAFARAALNLAEFEAVVGGARAGAAQLARNAREAAADRGRARRARPPVSARGRDAALMGRARTARAPALWTPAVAKAITAFFLPEPVTLLSVISSRRSYQFDQCARGRRARA